MKERLGITIHWAGFLFGLVAEVVGSFELTLRVVP
jgi:hypothetical protein